MGHRASLVIAEGDRIDVRYSHWGGLSIPDDLIYGPEATGRFIRELKGGPLLDNVWCEGLVLLDLNRRVLLFEGVSELLTNSLLRRVFFPLLRDGWPGWQLYRARRTVLDAAEHLGFPPEEIEELDAFSRIDFDEGDYTIESVTVDPETGKIVATEPEPPQPHPGRPAGTLLVVSQAREARRYASDQRPVELLSTGRSLLEALKSGPEQDGDFTLRRESAVRIDLPSRRIVVWEDVPEYRSVERIVAAWPRWEVVRDAGELEADPAFREAISLHPDEEADARARVEEILQKDKAGELVGRLKQFLGFFTTPEDRTSIQMSPELLTFARPKPPRGN